MYFISSVKNVFTLKTQMQCIKWTFIRHTATSPKTQLICSVSSWRTLAYQEVRLRIGPLAKLGCFKWIAEKLHRYNPVTLQFSMVSYIRFFWRKSTINILTQTLVAFEIVKVIYYYKGKDWGKVALSSGRVRELSAC